MILEHYLLVKAWTPNFDPMTDKMKKVLLWVHFPCLPIEYYDKEFLYKVGEKIGKPIKWDETTELATRGKFARL